MWCAGRASSSVVRQPRLPEHRRHAQTFHESRSGVQICAATLSSVKPVRALALAASLLACHCASSSAEDAGTEGGLETSHDGGLAKDAAHDAKATHDASRAETGAHDASKDGQRSPDAGTDAPLPTPTFLPFTNALAASDLAVIVNVDDPDSVAIGAYYQQKRNLPAANILSVHVPTGASITSAQFTTLKAAVDAVVPANVQAYALAFTQPYLVQCMSITSAFAFGFDTMWCNTTGQTCGATAESPYFQQDDPHPYTDFQVRPTMMLAGAAKADVLALIDRGVASDDTYPTGTDYMVITSDATRSVRAFEFEELAAAWDPATNVAMSIVNNSDGGALDYITGKTDVLFYFTGLSSVPEITTNTYLPGALADHLTSFGGQVPTSGQMSAVAWLEAGASASYGTVVEPCNYTEKFPDPSIAVPRYYRGGTALQAYWKSVEWPGEGLFIGEPLAAPWRSPIVTFEGGTLTIKTTALDPTKTYKLQGGAASTGPFVTIVSGLSIAKVDLFSISVPHATDAFYQLVEDVGDAGGQ
jgi:uncharacterized protein (TIGR03790 family)